MKQMNGEIERASGDERALSKPRERPPPRKDELPAAGLGEVARDVVDHAQGIARDALAIGKLEARRAVERARSQAREVAPRIAFGAVAGVAALVGVVLLLIALFIALGDPIPSVGWRMALFGVFFLVVAVIAGLFAGSHEEHRNERAQARGSEEANRRAALPRRAH
jgi:uncharacterized membrane protein YtjA (UPF0391 family)